MAGSKRKRLPLHSNSSRVRSIRISGKELQMNPISQSQTPPTPPSPTDTTAPSTDVVGDQPILALSAVSGLEDNNGSSQSPIPGPPRRPERKVPPGFFLLFGKLHPRIPQSQTPPPTNSTATSIGLVADQPITATSEVNGPQDTDNPAQSPASGLNAHRRRRNGTALDPKSVGVGFYEKKGKKKGEKEGEKEGEEEGEKEGVWESNLWFPGVRIPGRSKIGLQIFLGSYLTKEEAQDVHDRAALKLFQTKGVVPGLNFHESRHAEFMKEHKDWNFRDFVWQFRRYAPCFSKGKSCMKGVTVTEAAEGNLFEAKIAFKYPEKKVFYELGTFESEEEAGRAYDRALLFLHHEEREAEKLTVIPNFRPSRYSKSEILRAGKVNNIRKPILPKSIE